MDFEDQGNMERGAATPRLLSPAINVLAAPVGDVWVVDDDLVLSLLAACLGANVSDAKSSSS